MTTRDQLIAVRLTDEERAALQKAAAHAGHSLSGWLRLVAVTAAGDRTLLEQLRRIPRQ